MGHTGGVWSSQMRENIIISGSTDRTLKVWNAETGECIHTLYGHTSTVRCMHLHEKRYGPSLEAPPKRLNHTLFLFLVFLAAFQFFFIAKNELKVKAQTELFNKTNKMFSKLISALITCCTPFFKVWVEEFCCRFLLDLRKPFVGRDNNDGNFYATCYKKIF